MGTAAAAEVDAGLRAACPTLERGAGASGHVAGSSPRGPGQHPEQRWTPGWLCGRPVLGESGHQGAGAAETPPGSAGTGSFRARAPGSRWELLGSRLEAGPWGRCRRGGGRPGAARGWLGLPSCQIGCGRGDSGLGDLYQRPPRSDCRVTSPAPAAAPVFAVLFSARSRVEEVLVSSLLPGFPIRTVLTVWFRKWAPQDAW